MQLEIGGEGGRTGTFERTFFTYFFLLCFGVGFAEMYLVLHKRSKWLSFQYHESGHGVIKRNVAISIFFHSSF